MRRWLLIGMLLMAGGLQAGQVGGTLGKYSVAGAGVGALLGSAAATVPYLQSKEPYDFLTGAGVGMLSGAVIGYILGMVDLAGASPEASPQAKAIDGLNLAFDGRQMRLAWHGTF